VHTAVYEWLKTDERTVVNPTLRAHLCNRNNRDNLQVCQNRKFWREIKQRITSSSMNQWILFLL